VAAALLGAAACAHVEAPPGGPEDKTPPELVAVRPDSLSVQSAGFYPVVFLFDERLSERGAIESVLVSPRTSTPRVTRSGRELRVELQGGWKPGVVYSVTVLPTLQDLFGNKRTESIQYVFSTGPAIPNTHLAVFATDRITGKPLVGARVEAITADSLVYALMSDTAGAARFGHLPMGDYLVRAYPDQNQNRALDSFEPRDSARIRLGADSATVRLSVVPPDSTPPAIASVKVEGETVAIKFDDYLDPEQPLSPSQVEFVAPDGTTIGVIALGIGKLPAAPDTTRAARADTAAARRAAARDTLPPPKPLPSQTLVVRPAEPVVPGTKYTVRVYRIRNVVGLVAESTERTLDVPARAAAPAAAPAPAAPTLPDTVRPDTTTAPPGTRAARAARSAQRARS
jgi:hypothetical protein